MRQVRNPSHKAGASDGDDEAKLKRAIRAHSNFSETTPFAFFLIFLAELNGAPTSLVHGAFSALFAARIAHSEIFGIRSDKGGGIGRVVGFFTTYGITLGAGLYNVSLHIPKLFGAHFSKSVESRL